MPLLREQPLWFGASNCCGAALLKFVPGACFQPCDVVVLFYQFLEPPALVTTSASLKVLGEQG